jgi:hypothetical protein
MKASKVLRIGLLSLACVGAAYLAWDAEVERNLVKQSQDVAAAMSKTCHTGDDGATAVRIPYYEHHSWYVFAGAYDNVRPTVEPALGKAIAEKIPFRDDRSGLMMYTVLDSGRVMPGVNISFPSDEGCAGTTLVKNVKPQPPSPVSQLTLAVGTPRTALPRESKEIAADTELMTLARTTMQLFRKRNWAEIAAIIHPDAGVRLSPEPAISSRDVMLRREEFVNAAGHGGTEFTWGIHDGSGEPIRQDLAGYWGGFVYDRDYASAPSITARDTFGRSGNVAHNAADFYPKGSFIEFYFPPQTRENDWKAVGLVFERIGNRWYLVGIIHDQWMI